MASRMKRVTGSATKRRKAENARATRQKLVNLRSYIKDWRQIGDENNCDNDADIAKLLIECYHERKSKSEVAEPETRKSKSEVTEPETKKRRTSTPASCFPPELSSDNLSPIDTDRESMMSGLEMLKASSQSESENGQKRKVTGVKGKQRKKLEKKVEDTRPAVTQISFEEISDPDAGEEYDEGDLSYAPSLWEMSIEKHEPATGDIEQNEDVYSAVHDIEESAEDPAVDFPTVKPLKEVTSKELEDVFHLVSDSCLDSLVCLVPLSQCITCKSKLDVIKKKKGTAVVLSWCCPQKHTNHIWASQPMLRQGAMFGNLKFLSAITLSGNNYRKIALLCKFANIGIPSGSSFTQLQSHYIVPAVNRYWQTTKLSSQEELRATSVVVAGDGRMDSPGHSAKYCTYTVMDQASKKIIALEVVDKRECQLVSGRMEAVGFQRTMTDLQTAGMSVTEVVTDAHPQISAIMRKTFPHIQHSWDVWHGAKNLGKKLCNASQERGKQKLKPWISAVTNHFYYCAANCEKDSTKIMMTMTSVINHCTNRHEWALGHCAHGDIEEDPEKPWLDPCGPETEALERIITDTRFQNSLKYYVTCQTTSELESFNNHLLMYAAKRQAFTYGVYKCRCQLAAIDYMKHLDRPYMKNKKGEQCYNRTFSKAANHWSVRPLKEKKTYKYMGEILLDIFHHYSVGKERMGKRVSVDPDDPSRIASTIAPVSPPPTRELAERQIPRLKPFSEPSTS